MEAEHRYRIKQGGSAGCHCSPSHASTTPPCSSEMLERIAWTKTDSKTLERLVWSVYDGLLSPEPTPKLVGPESYNQVTRCLTGKVFRGLQVRCSARTSAQFDEPPTPKLRSVILIPTQSEVARKTEAMDTASPKTEGAGEGAVGGEQHADPDKSPMSWMRDRQRWYDNEMIEFWPLLCPLTDGKGTTTWWLAHRLLSTWHWSLVTHPTSCPPAPTNMEIGRWLSLDQEGSREDLWMEAYARSLQRVAEAATGRSWTTEGGGIFPQVSPLAQAFLMATGRRVSPCILRECWPPEHNIIPRQPMNETRALITQCLDKDATRTPSYAVWDMFAWPDSNKNKWKEDCLPYSPGTTVDLSSRMPGIRLALHDDKGRYQGVARVLRFVGHMLVYDPQMNGAGWIAMRGVPSSLTEVESQSASNLGNFCPCLSVVPVGPKPAPPSPVEPTVEYARTKAKSPWSTSPNLDRLTEWDTKEEYIEEVLDWSSASSPPAVVARTLQGEDVEETPSARLNRCLVSERFIEPGVASPHERTPEAETGKTPQAKDVPKDDQEQAHIVPEDEVVELHVGTEEL